MARGGDDMGKREERGLKSERGSGGRMAIPKTARGRGVNDNAGKLAKAGRDPRCSDVASARLSAGLFTGVGVLIPSCRQTVSRLRRRCLGPALSPPLSVSCGVEPGDAGPEPPIVVAPVESTRVTAIFLRLAQDEAGHASDPVRYARLEGRALPGILRVILGLIRRFIR